MYITFTQIAVYTIAVFAGVGIIVEWRLRHSENTVSDYIGIRNEQVKSVLNKIVDSIFETLSDVETRLNDLEGKNGRSDKENS